MRAATLFAIGSAAILAAPAVAVWAQSTVPVDGSGLGDFWYVTDMPMSDAVGLFLLVDFFGRALGMMLIGVGLYRLGVLSGGRTQSRYRTMVAWGFGVGVPIAAVGVAVQVLGGFSASAALYGEIPNSIATIPVVLGYIGAITLWNNRSATSFHLRIRSVGRMALTNYLMKTVLGVVILSVIFGSVDLSRWTVLLFVGSVWVVEILWSKPWLDRFAFGPAEWVWRSLTYRSFQPMRLRET